MNDWERPGSTVLAVTTPTCPNCRAMRPLVEDAAGRFAAEVALITVDAASDPDAAAALGVRGVPTYIARHDGVEVSRHTGRMAGADLDALFVAAVSGTGGSAGVSRNDRVLRLAVAGVFAAAAVVTATPALFALAGATAFFGVWDLVTGR